MGVKIRKKIQLQTGGPNAFSSRRWHPKRFSSTSNYTGLDNIPFWGVIQTPRSADERFLFIKAIFTAPSLGCKAGFSEVFQLAAVQTPVLPSPISAPGWAVSAKHVAMQQVARETWVAFERRLERVQVPAAQRPDYHKWIRFYLDFCYKCGHPPRSPTSLGPFLSKLAAKNQSAEQRHQATQAIGLLLGKRAEPSAGLPVQNAPGPATLPPTPGGQCAPVVPRPVTPQPRPIPTTQATSPPAPSSASVARSPASASATGPVPGRGASWEREYRDLEGTIASGEMKMH